MGLSSIHLGGSWEAIRIESDSGQSHMKIFGLGLSKTGTMSLTRALARLGYKAKHYPSIERIVSEAERYDALTDSPVSIFMEALDRLYPQAKFILTVRDEELWLESCRRHWLGRKPTTPGWRRVRQAIYGQEDFDGDSFRRVQKEHTARVRRYFDGRPDDLLILDICGGEGYELLCPFLGLPVLDEPFPHENRG